MQQRSYPRPGIWPAALAVAASLGHAGAAGAAASLARAGSSGAFARRGALGGLRGRQTPALAPPYVAPYVPKVGVANVTTPTALPPPPPILDPWRDPTNFKRNYQPLDTAVGAFIVGSFAQPLTVTPPPEQNAVDLAFACPVLLSWPDNVEVQVTRCDSLGEPMQLPTGSWYPSGSETGPILSWEEKCRPWNSMMVETLYTMPNGDFFGASQTKFNVWGNDMVLYDCSYNPLYTISEKVYKQQGATHWESCDKYKSCSGTVFLQYSIHDRQGNLVAATPYLNLFQNEFKVSDASNVEIATISRQGEWSPWETCSSDTTIKHRWLLKFNPGGGGIWADATKRWPLAEMMNMMSARDAYRTSSGMVAPTRCEVMNIVLVSCCIALLCALIICILLLLKRYVVPTLRHRCWKIEQAVFPHIMSKPLKYDST